MTLSIPVQELWFGAGVLAVLVLATVVGRVLRLRSGSAAAIPTLDNLHARINAWWVMVALLVLAILSGRAGSAVFFGVVSFLALREFMSIVPTRPGDHRSLLSIFLVVTPLQYLLVAVRWYGLYSIL